MSRRVGTILRNSFIQLISLSYVTGMNSRGGMPSSCCACSSFFSKVPTLPRLISYCGSLRVPGMGVRM